MFKGYVCDNISFMFPLCSPYFLKIGCDHSVSFYKESIQIYYAINDNLWYMVRICFTNIDFILL
jgi:hypothetical protein